MRDTLFISHANPEDNAFTLWLGTQLALQGYPVWSDLANLRGGEDFWRDIESAIRHRTAKFLLVTSRASNEKVGVRNELRIASNVTRQNDLSDFIIPLAIDDLPPSEYNIEISRLNAIFFTSSWVHGIKQLLEKLENDGVPKRNGEYADIVRTWWRNEFGPTHVDFDIQERYLSNSFGIESLPQSMYVHHVEYPKKVSYDLIRTFPYPAFVHRNWLITFASASDLLSMGAQIIIGSSMQYDSGQCLSEGIPGVVAKDQSHRACVFLMRDGWARAVAARGLMSYGLSRGAQCTYFTRGMLEGDSITFKSSGGKKTWRQMSGYRSIGKDNRLTNRRYWHFAVEAKPVLNPTPFFYIKSHVVFSDDGITAWNNPKRTHSARRRQCKNWWNDDWRDRILAFMSWLKGDSEHIAVPMGSSAVISIGHLPQSFISPVSYTAPEHVEQLGIHLGEEEDDDADEDGESE